MKVIRYSLLAFLASASLGATASAANVVTSIQDDLSYDENGKLTTHYLVYPGDNPGCPAASFPTPYKFETRPLMGEASQAVFPGYETTGSGCPVACVERGADRMVAHAVMPHRINMDSSENLAEWFDATCRQVEVCVINYHSRDVPIKLNWIDPAGGEKLHLELPFGEQKTRCFSSFIGHQFIAREGDTDEEILTLEVEYVTSLGIGESPPSGKPEGINFDKEIETTLQLEWKKHLRIKRTFSPLGFKKAKLPEDVFANMGAFYYNNRSNKVREEWDGKGLFVNWWETDCSFIQIPWGAKSIWQDRLRLLVEAWAGVPIEQTDMYGLRQYEPGARLLTHVDRESTHAVSLIVNIAQGNLSEPWPVEVFDHADRLHEVIMEPGDIVYYESAKALHSRNRPLSGENAYYTNLFTHYRPTGDPQWMNKPNTEGTPDPLMEVEGECKLKAVGTTELPNKQLGIVEAVRCDDKRLEETLSPTLFKATSGDDLIDWWRYSGDASSAKTVTKR